MLIGITNTTPCSGGIADSRLVSPYFQTLEMYGDNEHLRTGGTKDRETEVCPFRAAVENLASMKGTS